MVPVVFARRADEGLRSAPRMNVVAVAVLIACTLAGVAAALSTNNPLPLVGMIVLGLTLMQSPKVASQWERGVVLRLGRFTGLRGPGLFWL
jgi:hypothetical protein